MLTRIIPEKYNISLDLKYATKENFVKEKLYHKSLCFLHEKAAQKLLIASEIAETIGLQIKIFDAFRPFKIQEYMWNKSGQDDNLISNPHKRLVP